ncbi:coil containing protein [Vibrio phage 393E50-1]|nr:coil containing protein [Vibrio phage 393E50-1]
MNTIQSLVSEFQTEHAHEFTPAQRIELLRAMIAEHGYDNVMSATGYKISTLNMVMRDTTVALSDERIRQAVYVFNKLEK